MYSVGESLDQIVMPYNKFPTVVVAGIIRGEYLGFYLDEITGVVVYWEHDGTNMYIGLISPGTGWVAMLRPSKDRDE